MGVLINILIGIMIFLSILIILIVLIQEDKSGGGIGMIGGSSQSFLGTSSSNILTKITTVLMVLFFVLSIFIGALAARNSQNVEALNDDIIALKYSLDSKQNIEENKLSDAPKSILVEDFEKMILEKISDEKTKELINKYYSKSQDGLYYNLTNEGKLNRKKVVEILNSVNFSFEAKKTIVE